MTKGKADIITHSEMQCADDCLRKHQILYGMKLRPVEKATALRMGTAVHKALDLRAMGHQPHEAVLAVREDYTAYEPTLPTDRALEVAYEHEMVAQLLTCYFWYWESLDAAMEVVHTEYQFEIPILNPATGHPMRGKRYAGKIDKLVMVDGLLTIMEHKTTAQSLDPDSDYFKRLRIDSQIGNYFLAARQLGFDVQQILYDVIRKPTLRPKEIPLLDEDGVKVVLDAAGERVRNKDGKTWRQTGDAALGYTLQTRTETPGEYGQRVREAIVAEPEKYFTRRVIARTEQDVVEAQQALYDKAQRLAYHQRTGSFPRSTGSCIGFGRCACFNLCTSGFDPSSGTVPEGWERVNSAHQELEIPDNE